MFKSTFLLQAEVRGVHAIY